MSSFSMKWNFIRSMRRWWWTNKPNHANISLKRAYPVLSPNDNGGKVTNIVPNGERDMDSSSFLREFCNECSNSSYRWFWFTTMTMNNNILNCQKNSDPPKVPTLEEPELDLKPETKDDGIDPDKKLNPLNLMNFHPVLWPSFSKGVMSVIYMAYIRFWIDRSFSIVEFLEGVQHAIVLVSSSIAAGKFEDIEALVEPLAITEIKQYRDFLTSEQCAQIAVRQEDIFVNFVYSTKLLDKNVMEIHVVFHGLPGWSDNKPSVKEMYNDNKTYVTNYVFRRAISSGENQKIDDGNGKWEPGSFWKIVKLNHVLAVEFVESQSLFSR